MTQKTTPPRKLIWITCCILLIASGLVTYFSTSQLPAAITVNTKGQPTIGYPKSRVRVVVFEEPKCSNCRDYNDQIYPKIKKEFIDTNKITYTVIPVSFLPGSMPAAIACMCVYHSDPVYPNNDLFFTYLDYMYRNQPSEHSDWATPTKLVDFAEGASPAIPKDTLKKCVEMETYRVKIEQNTAYGKKIMDGRLSTPTVFVNGIKVNDLSYDEISKLIKEVLEQQGVH